MFIAKRFWTITLIQLALFALLYLWLRARYGRRRHFGLVRIMLFSGAGLYLVALWSYFLVGRENWIGPGAQGPFGDFVLRLMLAWFLQGFVLLGVLAGGLGVLYGVRWFDRWRSSRSAASGPEAAGPDGEAISRGGFLARSGALAALAIDAAPLIGTAGVLSGMFLGSREVVTRTVRLQIAGLAEDLKGLRIVQISDIHVGSVITEPYLEFCLDQLRAARGDLLAVTGDLIDFHNRSVPGVGRFLSRARSYFPQGVFVIPGNHDYFHDGLALKRGLAGGAFELLANQRRQVRRGRGEIEIVGVDYPWPFYPGPRHLQKARVRENLARALQGSPAEGPRVLLIHDPTEFEWLRKGRVRFDLMLSGHTHGGQVHLPGPEGGRWIPVERMYPYVDGLYAENDRRLYVNRGLGHGLPLRLDCPPEITVFELS